MGRLATTDDQGIPSAQITIYDWSQDRWNTWFNIQTDDHGFFMMQLTYNAVGVYYFYAGYNGDSRFASSHSDTVKVTVTRSATNLTLSNPSPSTILAKQQNYSISGRLTTASGIGIGGAQIKLYSLLQNGWFNFWTGSTDGNGYFKYEGTVHFAGVYYIYAAYNGTSQYEASTSNTVKLTVIAS